MHPLLKISEAVSLALHTMSYLAALGTARASTHKIASDLGVSEAHLAKVMQRLGRGGLVNSYRGPRGGFALARPPEKITLMDIYEAVEGPLAVRNCLLEQPVCSGRCILGDLLTRVSEQTREYFANTTLADLVH